MRVVSLIASSTEIICALGFEKNLVGRSHECDYPSSVKQLRQVTKPQFDTVGTSCEIDDRVKNLVRNALSVYEVELETLRELQPDVIVTQSQCEVCAVSLKDVEAAVEGWLGAKPQIVSLEPQALDDIWTDIQKVSTALGCIPQGDRLISTLKGRLSAVSRITQRMDHHPRVALIEWIDPLMAAGNWMPELVTLAGGVNLFGEAGKHSPWMRFEELVDSDPDVIIVSPCGFDIQRTVQEMPTLKAHPSWNALRAVREGRVYVADGNQYFNRPGPRVLESAEILAEIFFPEKCKFGHEGIGWIKG